MRSTKSCLSPREREVLAYIGAGLTYHQTARKLGISVHTVGTYLRRIRTKHFAPTLADLVRLSIAEDVRPFR
ncbi:response regulator transcription factor [Streptomyces sp. NPDC052396]|uniref:response regulator transcription factor n=1 Tax=Streptomyces sp. NPDC052396 TaxID=3365689 RepID=UPI0037D94C3E